MPVTRCANIGVKSIMGQLHRRPCSTDYATSDRLYFDAHARRSAEHLRPGKAASRNLCSSADSSSAIWAPFPAEARAGVPSFWPDPAENKKYRRAEDRQAVWQLLVAGSRRRPIVRY